jgi:hypothetical protein
MLDAIGVRAHGAFRRLLGGEVERGVHRQLRHPLAGHAQHRIHRRPYRVQGVRLVGLRRRPLPAGDLQRLGARRDHPDLVEVPLLAHQAQHEVAPILRPRAVAPRGVERRALGERRQHRPFGDRHLVDVLPEQVAARPLHAVHPVAEVDDVEVAREDLVFGEVTLEQARQAQLDELSA